MNDAVVSKGWTKLDSGIVDSTLWAEDHATIRVWIALLAKCDAGGFARVAVPAMARLCYMGIEEFEGIMDKLCAPDQYSRCRDDEGRRVARVEGGFVVLSYERYRSMRTRAATGAERKAQFDARQRAKDLVTESHEGNESNKVTPEAEAEAEAYTEADTTETARSTLSNRAGEFDRFWHEYPKKSAKKDARKAWKTHAATLPSIDELLSALRTQKGTRQWRDGIIPLPATWLRGARWDDEISETPSGEPAIDWDKEAGVRV